MIARLRPGLCLSLLLALPIAAQTNAPAWSSGEYRYDGAGNIVAIGSAAYGYDAVTRLTRAHVAPNTTYEYEYDPYGNRTAYSVNQQRVPIAVSSATNHLADATYDGTGNQLSRGATTATYDGFGMVTSYRFDAVHAETFVYNANDERIGVLRNTEWTWSLRDPGGRVLRQYRSSSTDPAAPWIWGEDFVYRGSLLLGSQRPPSDGGPRHYHLDHLGSPRLVTSASGAVVSGHDFLPFGEERTPAAQQAARGFDRESPHRFTAHERDYDTATPNTTSAYIDYMHARYYAAATGRFLSVDPVLDLKRSPPNPQMWNRYLYVLNNPLRFTDPTGRETDKGAGEDPLALFATGGAAFHSDDELGILQHDIKQEVHKATEWQISAIREMTINYAAVFMPPLRGPRAAQASYTVYRALAADGVTVTYVGMTSNIAARAAAHLRQKGIQIVAMEGLSGLNYRTARAVEQLLIQAYGGPKRTLMNKIWSIAAKRLGLYKKELQEASTLLRTLGYI